MPRPRKPGSIYDRFDRHVDRTFAEAATRYLAEFQGKAKDRAAQSVFAVAPYIGHLRLIDVDDEAMQQFKEDRRREMQMETEEMTLNQALRILVAAYVQDSDTENWSVGQGPAVPPSAIPALIEAWRTVMLALR